MGDENKELVRRLEEAWNRSDVDRVRELLAPDFVSHSVASGMPATVDAIVQAHQMSMQSFPDRKVAIEDILAEGDKVVVRCRTTGTNKGGLPWAGVPANDKPIDFSWISKYRDQQVPDQRGQGRRALGAQRHRDPDGPARRDAGHVRRGGSA